MTLFLAFRGEIVGWAERMLDPVVSWKTISVGFFHLPILVADVSRQLKKNSFKLRQECVLGRDKING